MPATLRRMEQMHQSEQAPTDEARVGDTVVAADGVLGQVDDIIRSETQGPAYIVVSAGRFLRRRYPVIPFALVSGVDRRRRRIHLDGRRGRLGRLSESVPLVL